MANGKAQKQALAKSEPTQALTERPAHLQRKPNEPRLGSENVTQNDILVPRLAICQSASFERKKSHAKYIDGLEEGMYFNTVTKQIYGRELDAIPVHFFKNRIRWGANIGDPIRCKSEDALIGIGDPGGKCQACPCALRDGDCTSFMNFPLLVLRKDGTVNMADVLIYPMKSLAQSAGKHLNSLNNIRNGNIFDAIYHFTTVEDHRESGDSFQPHVEYAEVQGSWPTVEQSQTGREAYTLIESWRTAGRLKVDEDSAETVAV